MPLSVEVDQRQLQRLERVFVTVAPRRFKRGVRRAMVVARRKTHTALRRRASRDYNIKIRSLTKAVSNGRFDVQQGLFSFVGSTRPFSLMEFRGTRQLKRGVKATVKGETTLFRHAFIRPGRRSGKRLVFERVLEDGKRVSRYPISAIVGPSAADMLNRPEWDDTAIDTAFPVFADELSRQIQVAIRHG